MKFKWIAILSMLIIATMVLSACGPTDAPAVEEPAGEEPVVEEPAVEEPAAEPVQIGVYSVSWSTTSINAMKGLIEKFNAEHEGRIVAEYIQGDWGDAETYITSGVAGGGGIADVIEYYLDGALNWYNQGYTIDLSPYITDEVRATIPEVLWAGKTAADGGVFESCTNTNEHMLIYYNPALLEEAGVEPPSFGETWTMEEFLENAKLLTRDAEGRHVGEDGFDPDSVVQWGFVPRMSQDHIFENLYDYTIQVSGKPMIRRGDDGEWDIFFDEEAMPVIEAFMSVITEGVTPVEAVGLGGSSQDQLFYQGTAAMVQRAYFNIAVLLETYPDFVFDVMPVPMEDDIYFSSAAVGQGFSVPVVSEHPAEAAEFVFWMQKAENQAIWAEALMLAPCNPDALLDPRIADNPLFETMLWYFDIQTFAEAEPNPYQEEFKTTVFGPTMMDVLMGELTLEEGIELIKEVSKDVLNQ